MSVRASFIDHFGEDQADRIIEASLMHTEGFHREDSWGGDPFQYHLLNVIAYECVSKYAQEHGFTIPAEDFRLWCVTHGDLVNADCDVPDYLGALVGAYAPFMKEPVDE